MPGRRDKKSLTIAHVVRYFHQFGGVETVVQNLAKEQTKKGNKVHIFTTKAKNQKKIKGVNIHSYSYKVIFNEPIYFFYKDLKKANPDIIHDHYPNPWGFLVAWAYAFFHRKRLKVTYHARASSSKPIAVLNRIIEPLFYLMVLLARGELIYTHSRIGPKIPGSRVELSQPIDKRVFRDYGKKRIYDLGFVGRLTKLKRVDWILRAAAKVDKNVKIVIVGDGPEEKNLKKLAKELGLKNVKFVGRVSHEETAKYYNMIKTIILPSRSEGLPVSILEAQACGCNVLATPVGGVPDILRRDRLFKDIIDLKNLIQKELMGDKK